MIKKKLKSFDLNMQKNSINKKKNPNKIIKFLKFEKYQSIF